MKLHRVLLVLSALILSVSADSVESQNKKNQESFWQVYTSALRGDRIAEYQVGVMYERGIGVNRDWAKAVEWYEKSAWQGHVDAQYNLALMYAAGRGVEQNEEHAMIWLAKAARQGDREARKLLLAIIDGNLDKPASEADEGVSGEDGESTVAIPPVTLIAKEGARSCTDEGKCRLYKAKTVLTSNSKRGEYYKISGIATKKGWKPIEKGGWIAEESVSIRN